MIARELPRLGLERGLREVTIAAAVSSMNSGDAESLAPTAVSAGKSRSLKNPFLIFCKLIFPLEHSMRCTSCGLLISRLKTATARIRREVGRHQP